MNDKVHGLLNDLAMKALNEAIEASGDEFDSKLDQALKTVDRVAAFEKIEQAKSADERSSEIEEKKLEHEKRRLDAESRSKDEDYKVAVNAAIVKTAEIALTGVLVPMIEWGFKFAFGRMCMDFDSEYSFTSTPGRSISSYFRSKR